MKVVNSIPKAVEDFFSVCLFFCVTEGYMISHCGGVATVDWALFWFKLLVIA